MSLTTFLRSCFGSHHCMCCYLLMQQQIELTSHMSNVKFSACPLCQIPWEPSCDELSMMWQPARRAAWWRAGRYFQLLLIYLWLQHSQGPPQKPACEGIN